MKLNKKLEIGLNAVVALKKREGFVRTQDIASEVGTTVSFLEQIMRNLRTNGIVNVKRGPGGGYALNKESEITAYSVAKAVGRFDDDSIHLSGTPIGDLRMNLMNAYRQTKV